MHNPYEAMPRATDAIPKRTPAIVLAEIETKLASIDGISTADAFALGGLVREYGQSVSGESTSALIMPMLTSMLRPKKDEDGPENWR